MARDALGLFRDIAAQGGAARGRRLRHRPGALIRGRMAAQAYPRHRPGHHQHPRHRVRRDGPAGGPAQKELPQIFPKPGWVEHDPEEIWRATVEACRERARQGRARRPTDIAGIGITNQRETTVVWDRATGKPVAQRHRLAGPAHRRRAAPSCERAGHETLVADSTGLLLDPYFSGTKIAWLLDERRRRPRPRPSRASWPSARSTASCSGA